MDAAIVAKGVQKNYGDLAAVRGVTFTVAPRQCFGFLGPNGAGKTSLMRMIGCVSPISAGELWVNGRSVRTEGRAIRATTGVVPQEETLDDELTVLQNLVIYARYFGMPAAEARQRAMDALERFALVEKAKNKIDELSGGMKRRLLIARGLINTPQLLLLDEPTTGLDPQARQLVWRALRALRDEGVTLLLTTHYMEEAEALCDHLIVLHEGRIVAEGTPADLIAIHVGATVVEVHSFEENIRRQAAAALRLLGVTVEETEDAVYGFGLKEGSMDGVSWDGVRPMVRPGNLEDVFLHLVGRGLDQ